MGMRAERDEQRPKRALTHVGGPTRTSGDPKAADILAHALSVDDVPSDHLTHGFHSYPARMHWATPARLLEGLEVQGANVLDPFSGSGTVLVEARVHGHAAVGVDLNPLAVRLARLKCDPMTAELREELFYAASEVRARSEELVQSRAKVRAELPPEELGWYEPHVLKEMAGLLSEIDAVEHRTLREALTLVFSSLVIKFSRQRSDTSEVRVEKRIRKGLVSEFFERKTHELCDRLTALSNERLGPRVTVVEADARDLGRVIEGRADIIITSPPYGGTYDYVSHHARRFAWLGLDASDFGHDEIGSRRRSRDVRDFEREMFDVMRSMHRVLSRDGLLVMQMGDGEHRGELVPADELVASIAADTGFIPVAAASQRRPDFHRAGERLEHLLLLRRAG